MDVLNQLICSIDTKDDNPINTHHLNVNIDHLLSDSNSLEDVYFKATNSTLLHPDYNILAARIRIYQSTEAYTLLDIIKENSKVLSEAYKAFIIDNFDKLDAMIYNVRDYYLGDTSFHVMKKVFFIKNETPQLMFMREAIGIHVNSKVDLCTKLDLIKDTYDRLSQLYFTHASPTIFNAGSIKPQHSSCFLLGVEDSIEGIFECLKSCAKISKHGGGLGVNITTLRGQGAKINGVYNGTTRGLIPWCKLFNDTARAVDQSSKRKGAISLYIEPWHSDIMAVLDLRKPVGVDELRARDLFYALWVPDIFMERVKQKGTWSLFSPNNVPELTNLYGEEFTAKYIEYEGKQLYYKQIPATDLWNKILNMQFETGMPYLLYKDHANRKSNQANVGVIKNSNLCAEIMEVSSHDSHAVCLTGDSKILTTTGYVRLDKLKADVDKVVCYMDDTIDGNDKPLTKHIDASTPTYTIINNGLRRIIKITLEDKTSITSTPDHLFYTFNSKTQEYAWHSAKVIMNISKDVMLVNASTCVYTGGNKVTNIAYKYLGHAIVNRSTKNAFIAHGVDNLTDLLAKYNVVHDEKDSVDDIFNKLMMTQPLSVLHDVVCDLSEVYESVLHIKSMTGIRDSVYVTYSSIASVTYLNEKQAVYDIVMSDRHTYVVNKYITHNCNLASLSLPRYVNPDNTYDYASLGKDTEMITANLNSLIDYNYYPTDEGKLNNEQLRPIGIGVQGLSDVFNRLLLPYGCEEAKRINKNIFETIYYHALKKSNELAKVYGPYSAFDGSPASQGKLQFDLWNKEVDNTRYDWTALKHEIRHTGLYNSLVTTCMPTASTSLIMGNTESIEPPSLITKRQTMSGEHLIINKYLVDELLKHGLWNTEVYNHIRTYNSIQALPEVPMYIKDVFKSTFEVSMKDHINLSIERASFIDQSQSLNIWLTNNNWKERLHACHMYGWENGLKTGMYYLRTQPIAEAITNKSTTCTMCSS